jgi:hypothetical protein
LLQTAERNAPAPFYNDGTLVLKAASSHVVAQSSSRIFVQITNASAFSLDHLSVTCSPESRLTLKAGLQGGASSTTVASGQAVTAVVDAQCLLAFANTPHVHIRFSLGGVPKDYTLPLPLSVSAYCEGPTVSKDVYMSKWGAAAATEQQATFTALAGREPSPHLVNAIRTSVFPSLRIGLVPAIDAPNGLTATGCSVFRLAEAPPVAGMCRIEGDVASNCYRVTVRAGDEDFAKALFSTLKNQLSA